MKYVNSLSKNTSVMLFIILLSALRYSYAQQSVLYDGELRIHILNSYYNLQLNFEATIASSSHWDFDNNLIANGDYTYQQDIVNYPNTNVYFNWE